MAFSTVTAFIVVNMTETASAAPSPIGPCTTTDALKPVANTVIANIVNPIKYFGWPVFGVVLVVAGLLAFLGAHSSNKVMKMVLWGFALLVILIPLAAQFMTSHGGPC